MYRSGPQLPHESHYNINELLLGQGRDALMMPILDESCYVQAGRIASQGFQYHGRVLHLDGVCSAVDEVVQHLLDVGKVWIGGALAAVCLTHVSVWPAAPS
eukprot:TRINITY_DN17735_c0_g1_i1.p1 TRINITY_DN17735_c0_g1~~TRINITY_DN17735_c0_g1_i1.p1  ORF type:complete len:101 (+),score=8.75 TRINITY_DN17735_c0_g1_i1:308-610(+)